MLDLRPAENIAEVANVCTATPSLASFRRDLAAPARNRVRLLRDRRLFDQVFCSAIRDAIEDANGQQRVRPSVDRFCAPRSTAS